MPLIVEIRRLIDEEITEMLWILSIRCAISYEDMALAVGRIELMQRPMPDTERIAKAKEKRLQLEMDNENLREQIVIVETRTRKPHQVVEEPQQIVEQVVEQVVLVEEEPQPKAKRQYKKKEVTEKPKKEVKEKKVKEVVEKPTEKAEKVAIDRTVTLDRLPNKVMLRLTRKGKTDKTVSRILTLIYRQETQTFFDQETHVEYKTLAETNRLWCRANDLTQSSNVWADFKAYCRLTEEYRSINALHEADWFADMAEPARNGFIAHDYIFPGEVVFERPMTPVLEVEEEKEPQKAARGRPKKDVANYSFEEPELGPEVVAEETAYRTSEDEEEDDEDEEEDVVTRNVEKFCVDGVDYFKCTESDFLYKMGDLGQPVEVGLWCALTKTIYSNGFEDVSDDDEE